MLKAGIVGLGWWGGTLVDAVASSDLIRVVAACTRSRSSQDVRFAADHDLALADDYAALLADPAIDAVILATPPRGHAAQIVAAAEAGKHVFCEKPFTMTRAEADKAITAVDRAGVTLGLGYNRRFHPSWIDLRQRIAAGELGTILHLECTMSGPNGLSAPATAWRSQAEEAPCGGLFPMGVHAIDGFVDLVGPIAKVFCQSLHRAVPGENDDTTAVLLLMAGGMSAYLGTMTATAPSFRFNVYGSKAAAFLTGMTHVAGQTSHQRRSGLFGSYVIQPVKGEGEAIEVPEFDLNRAELEAFASAAQGGQRFPIRTAEMAHVVAATEAIVESARTQQAVHVV
jgi:predicted dehydrogenase